MPTELPDLRGQDIVLDLETRDDGLANNRGAGWATGQGHIVGVAVGWQGGAVYAPIAHPDTENLDEGNVKRWVADLVRSGGRVTTHHGSYDWGWLGAQWGIRAPDGRIDDTHAMGVMVDENRLSYSLGALCAEYNLVGKDKTLLLEAGRAFGLGDTNKKIMSNLWRLPARFVGEYAEGDVSSTLRLKNTLSGLVDQEDVREAYQLEMDILPLCVEMRRVGVRLDTLGAERAISDLEKRSEVVLAEISRRLSWGRGVTYGDVMSPLWLEKAFTAEGVSYPRTPKTNRGSFSSEWMEGHAHWLPQMVTEVRKLRETSNKYLQGFLLDYAHRGRIHAEMHQLRDCDEDGSRGTRTYRFSYSDPALQQMPNPERGATEYQREAGRIIRGLFLPEEGEQWAKVDYSQNEYRLIVHFATLSRLARAEEAAALYRDNPETSFHQLVMDWTGLAKPEAKDANFAKAYGAAISKFAIMIGKDEAEAERIYKKYDEELPFVSALSQRCKSLADRRGWIRLLDGARCRWPRWEPAWGYKGGWFAPCRREEAEARVADPEHDWYQQRLRRTDTRKALNSLIQGSAARQIKMAMREMGRAGIVPLLQVHDELDDSIADPSEGERIREIMESVVELEVPVLADLKIGPNWGEVD